MEDVNTKTICGCAGTQPRSETTEDIVAIITARGGSKGIPHKNIKILAGKPLIAYTIEAALQCLYVKECFVTTDEPQIKEISLAFGAKIIDRPADLATDTALSRDVVRHALHAITAQLGHQPRYFVLLQPTSPLRNTEHLTDCLEQFLNSKKKSAISVTECDHHPFKCFEVNNDGSGTPLRNWDDMERPRQLLPKFYRPNGAIYIASCVDFMEKMTFFIHPAHFYVMKAEDSIDIDNEIDLNVAEMIIRKRQSV